MPKKVMSNEESSAAIVSSNPKIRFPNWWLIFSALYLLLRVYGLVGQRQALSRPLAQAMGWKSTASRWGAAFESGPLVGLEFTFYLFAGTIVLVGLPTLFAIVIYSRKKQLDAVNGLAVGFVLVLLIQLVMELTI